MYYVLDDNHQPKSVGEDILAWSRYRHGSGVLRHTRLGGDACGWIRFEFDEEDEPLISTVFLGVDHGFTPDSKKPVLFETMVFGGKHHDYQERYCTWDEAMAGHERVVAMVRESMED